MAIGTPVQRTVGAATAVTNANTAAFTPAANALQVAYVHTARAAGASNIPTIIRSGLSWTWIAGIEYLSTGTRRRLDVFAQMEAAPINNAANIAYAGQTQDNIQWEIFDMTGTATTIAAAIRQSVTASQNISLQNGATVTMAAFSNAANATIIGVGTNAAETFTASPFYTILGSGNSGANGISASYRLLPDYSPATTWNVAAFWGAIGLEIVSAVGGASGTLTARPNSTLATGAWALTGAASHHVAQSDNSDASYSSGSAASIGELSLGVDDLWSAVYNTRLVSLTQRYRIEIVGGTYVNPLQTIEVQGTRAYTGWVKNPIAPTTFSFVWATAPDGNAWRIDRMFDLKLIWSIYSISGSTFRILEQYVDLLFNDRPAATLVTPASGSTITTTTRPAVTWTYSDPEGDIQERWQVKIFSAAQYGAVGFDAETSTPTDQSGEQSGTALTWTPNIDLPNAVYRAYVKVSDAGAGGIYGVWNYVQWTQNVVAPTVPTLTASAQNDQARIRLVIQGSSGGAGDPPNYFTLEYSDDGGTTWAILRDGAQIAPDASYRAVLLDYEAPPGTLRSYRAKAVRLVGALALGSAWSTVASATQTPARSWLKDPLDPTLNHQVQCEPFIENEERKEQVGVFYPYGGERPVVVAGVLTGWDGQTTIYAATEADREAVEALLSVQHALLFQAPSGTNRYLRIITRRRVRHTCDVYSYPIAYVEIEAP